MLKTEYQKRFIRHLFYKIDERQLCYLIEMEAGVNPYKKFKHISDEGLTRLYKAILHSNSGAGDNFTSGLFLEDKLTGLAKIESLDWYTNILKIKSAKVALLWLFRGKCIADADKDLLMRDIISCAEKRKIRYLTTRINFSEAEKQDLFFSHNFSINDKILNLYLDCLKDFDMPDLTSGIRVFDFLQSDIPQIRQIVYRSYSNVLLNEKKFSRRRVREFYSYWSWQCCRGRSDAVLVMKRNGKVLGFMACDIKRQEEESLGIKIGFVDMIIIDRKYQRQGLGAMLLSAGLDWFRKKNVSFVELGVSYNNHPAIRLYKKMRFKELSSTVNLSRFLN